MNKTVEVIEKDEIKDVEYRLKSIFGGSIGNLVEWYDWYSYSAFALYFSPVFFPNSNPTAQLLDTAGIFAVGFLMRPIGGWLFGGIADKYGRKRSMALSVLIMAIGSLIIGLTPGYNQIGIAAPFLLLFARLIQGLSTGGEYGTSATYLSEMATKKHRGFYSSFQYVTLIGGQLLALGIQLILQNWLLTSEELHAWGWRIPFFIGAILSFIALYLRRHIAETAVFNAQKTVVAEKTGIRALLKYPKEVLTVMGLTLGGTIAFYTFSTYMQKFLVNTVHLSKEKSTILSFSSLLIFAILQPLFGLLSDKIGRKPLLIGFGVLGTLCTYPILITLTSETNTTLIFLLMIGALIIVSGYTSINAVVKAELFPAHIRALGVGLPYALTVAIFGGTAEYLALWFKGIGHESYFYWYVSFCILISLVLYTTMKDTKHHSKIED
ncbi:MFS transporter [Pedobacter metabolipauper]|uniref:MHS family alpha-ketoglutarate permease-like MFS transporter n=1 Tax=Pedobacter metabolipauper TaxID=425513 RepID=A0A4R6SXA7_9SPHI|nr:MFS transporter [Pedobacter metabolipauper]TDQ08802.1 MHS family alpha-ketoglutarate permease-like MFS transporter [Pedobacter metabolipauper]